MRLRLPTPVYERIPQFWFLLGLLFVANGLYLGLDIPISLGSVGIGFVCCLYGAGIAVVRIHNRRNRSEDNNSAASAN